MAWSHVSKDSKRLDVAQAARSAAKSAASLAKDPIGQATAQVLVANASSWHVVGPMISVDFYGCKAFPMVSTYI